MRLINADALEKIVHEIHCKDCYRRKGMKNGKMRFVYEVGDVPCRSCELADMIDYLADAPTIDAVPVVHGENITEENEVDQFVCSECGIIIESFVRKEIDEDDGEETYHEYVMRYCPNCGAKMVGKEKQNG